MSQIAFNLLSIAAIFAFRVMVTTPGRDVAQTADFLYDPKRCECMTIGLFRKWLTGGVREELSLWVLATDFVFVNSSGELTCTNVSAGSSRGHWVGNHFIIESSSYLGNGLDFWTYDVRSIEVGSRLSRIPL